MELQVLNHVQEFNWNFQEIKDAVAGHIEKYHGLVVTEDNLKDMESAQKEIAAVRLKIDGFRKEVKKRMEEPYKQFEGEIKELQALVEQAEAPLKKQILQYELDRVKAREAELMEFGQKTAKSLGLRDEYFKLAIQSKWTLRTAKITAVKKEIIAEIEAMLANQRRDDEAAELRRQREEMITQLCESYSIGMGLKTAIVPEDIAHLVRDCSLADIPAIIQEACGKRLELEIEAAKPVEPPATPEVPPPGPTEEAPPWVPPAPPEIIPEDYAAVPGPDPIPEPPPVPPRPRPSGPPPMPPIFSPRPPAPDLWDIEIKVVSKRCTVQQAANVRRCLDENGFTYEIIKQEKVV